VTSSSTQRREAYFLEYAIAIRKVAKMPLMVTAGFRSRAAWSRRWRRFVDVIAGAAAVHRHGSAERLLTGSDSALPKLRASLKLAAAFRADHHGVPSAGQPAGQQAGITADRADGRRAEAGAGARRVQRFVRYLWDEYTTAVADAQGACGNARLIFCRAACGRRFAAAGWEKPRPQPPYVIPAKAVSRVRRIRSEPLIPAFAGMTD